jgi:hypothetical protein
VAASGEGTGAARSGAADAAIARRWTRAAIALALLPPLALAAAERYLFGDLDGFPLDDSWIHLVFARHLAHGDGLVFNPGQPVAGSTAPLWTAILALLATLPGSAVLWAKAAGIAAQAATAAATVAVARRLGFRAARAGLAGVLVALSEGLVLSALSGMEVGFFTFLTLAGLARHLDERADPGRPPVAFLLFGLAALARPEGLLLPVLAAADLLLAARGDGLALSRARLGRALAGVALAALVIVPVALVYLQFSGSPLPTTLAAKSSGPPRLVPELRFLEAIFALLFAAQPLPALLAAGGAVVALRRLGGPRDAGLLLPAWTFGLPVAAAMLSSGEELLIGNFGRYFFPLLPAVVLLGLLALEGTSWARFRTLHAGRIALPLGALAIVVLVGLPAVRSVRAGALYLRARANVEDGDGAAAAWLAGNVPGDAPLAVCDIGLVGWRLPNPILDLGGIVSPDRRAFLGRMARERALPWPAALRLWLEEKRPEYVVVYPAWFPLLEHESERFPPLHRIRIADNVALAGDELVVYATPWTRNRTPGER